MPTKIPFQWLDLILGMPVRLNGSVHSLCISLGGFTALGAVKWLYVILPMPVKTNLIHFILTLYLIQRIHGLLLKVPTTPSMDMRAGTRFALCRYITFSFFSSLSSLYNVLYVA